MNIKNIFLVFTLIFSQAFYASSFTVSVASPVQENKKRPLLDGSWKSTPENEAWKAIESEVSEKYKDSFEVPVSMQQASIAISSISGKSVDRIAHAIAFQRFIGAVKNEKFENLKKDTVVKSVEIIVNDKNYSFCPVLIATIFDKNNRSVTVKI